MRRCTVTSLSSGERYCDFFSREWRIIYFSIFVVINHWIFVTATRKKIICHANRPVKYRTKRNSLIKKQVIVLSIVFILLRFLTYCYE